MKLSIKKKCFRHPAVHKSKLNIDRQVCVIKTVVYRVDTDRQKHRQTDRKVKKTDGPKMLSNDIFYFKTVIIGGPIMSKQL